MNTKDELLKTVVIFRTWKETGDVIALFPTEPADLTSDEFCMSYMHVGQHGDALLSHILTTTNPAVVEQYTDLKHELENLEYNLTVVDASEAMLNTLAITRHNNRIKMMSEIRSNK